MHAFFDLRQVLLVVSLNIHVLVVWCVWSVCVCLIIIIMIIINIVIIVIIIIIIVIFIY